MPSIELVDLFLTTIQLVCCYTCLLFPFSLTDLLMFSLHRSAREPLVWACSQQIGVGSPFPQTIWLRREMQVACQHPLMCWLQMFTPGWSSTGMPSWTVLALKMRFTVSSKKGKTSSNDKMVNAVVFFLRSSYTLHRIVPV